MSKNKRLAIRACESCRMRKKRCDRLLPSCTTCIKKAYRCLYDEHKVQMELYELRARVGALTDIIENNSTCPYIPTTSHLSTDLPTRYPIPSSWYIPFLLQHSLLA
ncbi:hypothetical protein F5884DRAFT_814729 [Xylogone sp. PMI_703]|nr:hypothetical protein F5884DRAFT_814729 [Xylogone sp. PMI_703]